MTIRILPTPSTGVPQFSPRRQKLPAVSIRGKDTALPLKDILFFETGRHVTLVHTLTDTFSFARVLTEVREDLKDCPTFLAVGRSYLVNRPVYPGSH